TRFSRDWSSDVCSSDLYLTEPDTGTRLLPWSLSQPPDSDIEWLCRVSAMDIPPDYKNARPHKLNLPQTEPRSASIAGPLPESCRSEERRVGKEGRRGAS